MRTAVKIAFAAVLAVLLFCTPLGACADSLKTAGEPSHPCCPKKPVPLPEDCARPGCVYMDTHVVVDVAAPAADGVPVAELAPIAVAERPAGVWVPVATLTPLALRQRVVLFHQFLI